LRPCRSTLNDAGLRRQRRAAQCRRQQHLAGHGRPQHRQQHRRRFRHRAQRQRRRLGRRRQHPDQDRRRHAPAFGRQHLLRRHRSSPPAPLQIGADNNLGTAPGAATAGQLTLDGGTLQTTANFTLNANRGIALGAGDGTIQTNTGTTLTYNGIALGAGDLNKTGGGTLALGGANNYGGATNINAGTLQLGASNVLPNTTAVTVASGATFDVNNRTETVSSLAGAGTVTLGTGTGTLILAGAGTSTTFSGAINGSPGDKLQLNAGTTFTLGKSNVFRRCHHAGPQRRHPRGRRQFQRHGRPAHARRQLGVSITSTTPPPSPSPTPTARPAP
jgi:autotransporter-associated beta strand protein